MTARLPSVTRYATNMVNGQPFGVLNNPNGSVPTNTLGYLYGAPKEKQVGRTGAVHDVYGGASTYYVLSQPGTVYQAHLMNDGMRFPFEISFLTAQTDRFCFLTHVPHPNYPNDIIAIANAMQLFEFLHPSLPVEENSLYDAIILANGQPFRSVLTINQQPGRRRAPYCYQTHSTVPNARFYNPQNHSEYIILRYEHLNRGTLASHIVDDICVGDVVEGGVSGEVIDVAPYMDWRRQKRVRGKATWDYVRNYCSR